ncbi:MAG: hypothetical protein JXA37_08015 [Chloroflexia bacterium]|nr:hypothetical protein [Chloroflexia bacterium]
MTVYYPSLKPAVSPLTMINQVRRLPFAGEVLVRVGNRLEPDQVVARTLIPQRGQRFPVARILGIQASSLPKHLLLEHGADVEAGDILVRVGRWRQRAWRAPLDGVLSTNEVEQGYLIITPPAHPLELRAHLKGFVSAVEPYHAVTIQTPAALVQGVFGLGGERHGVLRTAVTDETDELLPEMLDERSSLSILVGGALIGAKALARAVELQVRGLVVGGITEESLRLFLGYSGDSDWHIGGRNWSFPPNLTERSFPLTLLVTEGVGYHPMCSRAFELLTSYDGSEASMDGQTSLHRPQIRRPYVAIPLSRADPEAIAEDEYREINLGDPVRILSHELLGQTGTLVAFLLSTATPALGERQRRAAVRLADGQIIEVPLSNLEVLGEK